MRKMPTINNASYNVLDNNIFHIQLINENQDVESEVSIKKVITENFNIFLMYYAKQFSDNYVYLRVFSYNKFQKR